MKCRCGLAMMPTRGTKPGWCCPNCDHVQPQEPFSRGRAKTTEDVRFDMYWLRVMDSEYTDNTENSDEPGVGTTNPEDGGETSPENEGDNNG